MCIVIDHSFICYIKQIIFPFKKILLWEIWWYHPHMVWFLYVIVTILRGQWGAEHAVLFVLFSWQPCDSSTYKCPLIGLILRLKDHANRMSKKFWTCIQYACCACKRHLFLQWCVQRCQNIIIKQEWTCFRVRREVTTSYVRYYPRHVPPGQSSL